MNFERRFDGTSSIKGRLVEGHASVFNSRIKLGPGIFEIVAPGAFQDSLKAKQDVRLLVDHDSSKLLGRRSAGTLRLSEDDHGLAVSADLPPTSLGNDVAILMERGDLTGMSFQFETPPAEEEWSKVKGGELRTLKKLNLIDVSLVTFPAYPDATAALRSRPSHFGMIVPLQILTIQRLWSARLDGGGENE